MNVPLTMEAASTPAVTLREASLVLVEMDMN